MKRGRRHAGLFESTTLRLTVWYVTLLMMLSLLLSVVVYEVATNEFNHALRPVPPELQQELQQNNPLFSSNRNSFRAERQRRLAESSTRIVGSLVIFNAVVLAGGTALSYLLARRTLQPIKEALESQSRFASDAAHELRTPLSVMQAEIEVGLRGKQLSETRSRDILLSALEEVSRLRTLTDSLLALASQNDLPKEVVEVSDAVKEAVGRLAPLARTKQMSIQVNVPSMLVVAHGDSVVEVLSILLDNAIKYAPAKSPVMVTGTATHGAVTVSVHDEGPGIPADEQSKVFERFYRSDASRSKQYVEGHGLGLSLARRLSEEMHGELTVESDGKKGTTFTLTLPQK